MRRVKTDVIYGFTTTPIPMSGEIEEPDDLTPPEEQMAKALLEVLRDDNIKPFTEFENGTFWRLATFNDDLKHPYDYIYYRLADIAERAKGHGIKCEDDVEELIHSLNAKKVITTTPPTYRSVWREEKQ